MGRKTAVAALTVTYFEAVEAWRVRDAITEISDTMVERDEHER